MALKISRTAPEILDATCSGDAERWATLVAGSPAADVYYLPAYTLASSKIEDSHPLAIVAGSEHCGFLAPLLVRRLSAVVNGSTINWSDVCSPYGYGGLLALSTTQPSAGDLMCFLDELQSWCQTQNAACCVLRLHPLMRQDEWFTPETQGLFTMRLRGRTAAIDLTKWDDSSNRPLGLRKDRRWDLNRASRQLRVTWATGQDRNVESSVERFIGLYESAMEVRNADRFYRFPPAYFSQLLSLERQIGIALAWYGDQLAGGSIFLAGRDYAHYHLAAGNEIGMKYGAATLLIAEGAKWARGQGCKLLHLGGGLSSGDSLEHFKRSFDTLMYRYAYVLSTTNAEQFDLIRQSPEAPWPYRADEP